ncbi:acyl-CoA thioesterase [Georgenia sp. Z1344]|uniref:acyl-CoA thioesterase n=1 Tax=Georgenia sp. Z1344 TaxID=3416706 RepID=UPI003CE8EDA6
MPRLTIPVRLRWSDIDAYRHVNNAKMLGILEECRIQAFWQPRQGEDSPAMGPGSGTNTLIARQEIEYLAPVEYSLEPLQVELWISHMGGASIDVCYEIPGPDGPAARATTTLVLVDEETGRPRRITAAERSAWSELTDAAIRFRRRDRDTSDGGSSTVENTA